MYGANNTRYILSPARCEWDTEVVPVVKMAEDCV